MESLTNDEFSTRFSIKHLLKQTVHPPVLQRIQSLGLYWINAIGFTSSLIDIRIKRRCQPVRTETWLEASKWGRLRWLVQSYVVFQSLVCIPSILGSTPHGIGVLGVVDEILNISPLGQQCSSSTNVLLDHEYIKALIARTLSSLHPVRTTIVRHQKMTIQEFKRWKYQAIGKRLE